MDKTTTYYATFFSPGSFVANQWDRPLSSPDPKAVEWPDNAYAFQVYRREDVHDGPTVYRGKPEMVGPLYYRPDSQVQTADEVRADPRATSVLISNLSWIGSHVVWSRWGNWPQPFDTKTSAVLQTRS